MITHAEAPTAPTVDDLLCAALKGQGSLAEVVRDDGSIVNRALPRNTSNALFPIQMPEAPSTQIIPSP